MGKVSFAGICLLLLFTAANAAGAISIENLKKLNITDTNLWDPVISPDGTKIAYVAYDESFSQQVFVINVDGAGKKKLTNDARKKWEPAWGADKIAYISLAENGLEKIFVMNPDGTENGQLISDNTRQGMSTQDKGPAWASPSWSHDGKYLVYTSLDDMGNPKIYIVNADGTGKKLVFNDTQATINVSVKENQGFKETSQVLRQWSPAFSPDGKNIVYVSYNERLRQELFITDISGSARRQLTFDEINKNYPEWGPDGTITYVSYENNMVSLEKIFAINEDGSNKRLFVVSDDYRQQSPSFSLDGSKFTYVAIDRSGNAKIAVGDVAGLQPTVTPTVAAPTITPTPTIVQTPLPTETTTPAPEKTPSGLKSVVQTMLVVLGIIVVALLEILAISNILTKK